MANWTLAEIRRKVRQVTGRLSTNEMRTEDIDEYINKYYQFTFHAEVKLERKHTYFEFDTAENTHLYNLPDVATTGVPIIPAFTNLEPPATLDNLSLLWYQEPAAFFENNPHQVSRNNTNTGDGSTTGFTLTSTPFPILPGSVIVNDKTEKS